MAITRVRHVWAEPDAEPSELHIEFDRELTEREASELAQAVAGVHERHEAARSFLEHDPHHARHVSARRRETLLTETPDVDEDGAPIELEGVAQVTRTFTGMCGDCGRTYVAGAVEPFHYVCPSLPAETAPYLVFREKPCHEGCVIDCGRDSEGRVIERDQPPR